MTSRAALEAHQDDSYGGCVICREYVPHTDEEMVQVPFPCPTVRLAAISSSSATETQDGERPDTDATAEEFWRGKCQDCAHDVHPLRTCHEIIGAIGGDPSNGPDYCPCTIDYANGAMEAEIARLNRELATPTPDDRDREVERIAAALRPWLRHHVWCNCKTDDPPDAERCKCGLRAGLRASGGD